MSKFKFKNKKSKNLNLPDYSDFYSRMAKLNLEIFIEEMQSSFYQVRVTSSNSTTHYSYKVTE